MLRQRALIATLQLQALACQTHQTRTPLSYLELIMARAMIACPHSNIIRSRPFGRQRIIYLKTQLALIGLHWGAATRGWSTRCARVTAILTGPSPSRILYERQNQATYSQKMLLDRLTRLECRIMQVKGLARLAIILNGLTHALV